MKLKLKNFRCYIEKEFDFGEVGTTLLLGKSGCGKSTLLMAIQFVLFGTGSKVVSYGKTSCSVEMEIGDMKIVRTKRPNRLVINDEFEDLTAQSIIDKKFGDTFDVTGYIAQNAYNSFIMMSPIEKLGFLEKFAFADVNLCDIKEKCKDIAKQRSDDLISIQSKIEMTTGILAEIKNPEYMDFPVKCSKQNRERVIKNEEVKLKNCCIVIKRHSKQIEKLSIELNDIRVLNASIDANKKELSKIQDKIRELKTDIDYKGDDFLESYTKRLASVVSQRELVRQEESYNIQLKQLEDMRQKETENYKNEIESIRNKLWKEYSKPELEEVIADCEQAMKDLEKLKGLHAEQKKYKVDKQSITHKKEMLEKMRIEYEECKIKLANYKLCQEMYTCPSCNSSLHLVDKQLQLTTIINLIKPDKFDEIEKRLSTLRTDISKLEREIPILENNDSRYNEIETIIQTITNQYEELPEYTENKTMQDELYEYRSTQISLEKKLKELETKISSGKYSVAITSFERDIQEKKSAIDNLKQDIQWIDEKHTETELRTIIDTQQKLKQQLHNTIKIKSELQRDETLCISRIQQFEDKHQEKYTEIRDEKDIENEIKDIKLDIDVVEKDKEQFTQNVALFEKYKEYEKKLDTYNDWTTKLNDLIESEKYARKKLSAINQLKEKILEAESIAILNVINSINNHAQIYLDDFFTDDPISVRLLPFKETKKGSKAQINIQIEYKGQESGVECLSGGELSRVILAYTLALAEMFNTPLVMLDECTSSLDQELTTTVVESIKTHFEGKLVLIVAHQVVVGAFDKVINVL
jgi:exonuclease SbcC